MLFPKLCNFWLCFWTTTDVNVFDDVLQNAKHCANHASNHANRPPGGGHIGVGGVSHFDSGGYVVGGGYVGSGSYVGGDGHFGGGGYVGFGGYIGGGGHVGGELAQAWVEGEQHVGGGGESDTSHLELNRDQSTYKQLEHLKQQQNQVVRLQLCRAD